MGARFPAAHIEHSGGMGNSHSTPMPICTARFPAPRDLRSCLITTSTLPAGSGVLSAVRNIRCAYGDVQTQPAPGTLQLRI
jgi:hypothetical protein